MRETAQGHAGQMERDQSFFPYRNVGFRKAERRHAAGGAAGRAPWVHVGFGAGAAGSPAIAQLIPSAKRKLRASDSPPSR
jgi:hypothetical protein